MKLTKEIFKSLLVVLFWAVATTDFLLIIGEDGNISFTRFIIIKAGAMIAAYGLYCLGKYAWNKGIVPEWYVRCTETLKQNNKS